MNDRSGLMHWLSKAKRGDVFWTDHTPQVAKVYAQRSLVAVSTRVYYAVHPGSREAEVVTRVELTHRMGSYG